MSELRRLREAKSLTRDELAAKSGVSSLTIRAHELGSVNGTETKTAEAIAQALGVPTVALFFPLDTEISVSKDSSQEAKSA